MGSNRVWVGGVSGGVGGGLGVGVRLGVGVEVPGSCLLVRVWFRTRSCGTAAWTSRS